MLQTGRDRETVWLFHVTKLWKQLEITVYVLYRGSRNNKGYLGCPNFYDTGPRLMVSFEGSMTSTIAVDAWQLNIYNGIGLSRRGLEHQSLRMLSERSTDTTEPPLRWKDT